MGAHSFNGYTRRSLNKLFFEAMRIWYQMVHGADQWSTASTSNCISRNTFFFIFSFTFSNKNTSNKDKKGRQQRVSLLQLQNMDSDNELFDLLLHDYMVKKGVNGAEKFLRTATTPHDKETRGELLRSRVEQYLARRAVSEATFEDQLQDMSSDKELFDVLLYDYLVENKFKEASQVRMTAGIPYDQKERDKLLGSLFDGYMIKKVASDAAIDIQSSAETSVRNNANKFLLNAAAKKWHNYKAAQKYIDTYGLENYQASADLSRSSDWEYQVNVGQPDLFGSSLSSQDALALGSRDNSKDLAGFSEFTRFPFQAMAGYGTGTDEGRNFMEMRSSDLGYQPNLFASGLSSQETHTSGLVAYGHENSQALTQLPSQVEKQVILSKRLYKVNVESQSGARFTLAKDVALNHFPRITGDIQPTVIITDSKGEKWPIKCKQEGNSYQLRAGWIALVNANNLREGDSVIFSVDTHGEIYLDKDGGGGGQVPPPGNDGKDVGGGGLGKPPRK